MDQQFDIVIIGAGPCGYTAAFSLADRGYSVALIEKDNVGGVCLNRGCMPTKYMVEASKRIHELSKAKVYGLNVNSSAFDFKLFKDNQLRAISRLSKGLHFSFKKKGITVLKGEAKIVSDNQVEINTEEGNEKISFKNLIIASGSKPLVPSPWKGINGVIDSESFWKQEDLPKDITIIGGGVIGCEYSASLALLGYNVTLIEKLDRLIISEDEEVSQSILQELKKIGVKVYLGNEVKNIENDKDNVKITLGSSEAFDTGVVIVCIGRELNLLDLGLDNIGLDKDKLKINEDLSLKNNIWIGGDIANGPGLAHKAYYDADIISAGIAGEKSKYDYSNMPMVIYTTPEISRVGLTESDSKKDYDVMVVKTMYAEIGKAVVENSTKGFLKLVADKKTRKVLGITIMGSHATELQGISLLIIKNGMSIDELAHTSFAHPTMSEIFKHTAEKIVNSI